MIRVPEGRSFLKPREVAEVLGVSVLTLYRRRRDGTGPRFVRLGSRGALRYSREAVIEWLQQNEQQLASAA